MSSKLVAYFSASGTTARAAQNLARAIDADLFEIVPEQPYSSADLNWNNSSSRSSVEMNDDACRPGVSSMVDHMESYDTVFVGFPIWWYVEPRIIDTFLESYNFEGKTIVPFATSGGSGLGKAPQRMQTITKGSTVKPGKMLNGHQSAESLRLWVSEMGL